MTAMLVLVAADDGRIEPGQRKIVPVETDALERQLTVVVNGGKTPFAIPRPSLVAKHGVTVLGAPQQISLANPRVILFNSDPHTAFRYKRGHPVAELWHG